MNSPTKDGVFPKGRVCASERCTTILSMYNSGPSCHVCTERVNAAERAFMRSRIRRAERVALAEAA